ncbi:PqiB family protein [Gilvimarinus agarilyticus]|uniref:PqiB family protein n=1 Tax=Gilvimarinus agarilyticus TaxID=679259 RepID=UPI0006972035|nr:MlaD family protein [Gilvimarinus agarilyticus]
MNDKHGIAEALPGASIHRKRGISAIWLLPLLAVVLGGWLAYKHFNEAGVNIVVIFNTGEGVEVGKTEVRYKGIKVGIVDELHVQPNMDSVAAQVTLSKQVESALRKDTRFWLVKPELSLGGVQGLDTLVSGNYIAMRPGESNRTQYVFNALQDPPPPEPGNGDLQIQLTAPDVGSLNTGSPIHYRKLRVGEIVDYSLSEDRNRIIFQAQIKAEYANLVNSRTRFWNTSGISISGDLNSIELNTDSLASVILGGLSFDTRAGLEPGDQAHDNDVFRIYPNFTDANTGHEVEIEFPSAEGIKANHTEIRYKGFSAGKIINLEMKPDYSGVIATASIDPLADVQLNESTQFWLATPSISLSKISGLSTLLTGTHIEMDFSHEPAAKQHSFVALAEAPAPHKDKPGLYITLASTGLEGITRSSEIYYRNVSIGKVIDYQLNDDHTQVLMDVHIPPKFAPLVTREARFYQNSGIHIDASLSGINIQTESLASVLRGGIGLMLPEGASEAPKAETDSQFTLHPSRKAATERGPTISIRFADSENLSAGADIRYLGVKVGVIERVELNHPEPGVTAYATLEPGMDTFATSGTVFWRVKPNVGLQGISNLGTLVFGQYLAAEPGTGAVQYDFIGRESAPEQYLSENGLTLTLQAPSLASIQAGRSVFYREIPVGTVTGFELDDSARHVNIHLHIDPRYAPLVKTNSVFWNATGINFDFGWLSGATLKTGSVQSLIAGGIAFATPSNPGDDATDGMSFTLHEAPDADWQEWAPEIPLTRQAVPDNSVKALAP